MGKTINVGFAGNPNCGKTTLFNAFTGANLKVANWPGVTVEKKEGELKYKEWDIKIIDLPGIYSLSSYTIEERVARQCILEDEVDIIINVVDASSLERNLYLTLQLLELGKPVILALNMMDIVEEQGMEIDTHRLPEMLSNIAVVPVSARKRTGLDVLLHAVVHHYNENLIDSVVKYSDDIEEKIIELESQISQEYPEMTHLRWHSIKVLEADKEIMQLFDDKFLEIGRKDYGKRIINEKYNYIEEIINEVLFYKEKKSAFTDKIDEVLTNKILGIPIFLAIMAFVFFLTFNIGDILKGGLEILVNGLGSIIYNELIQVNASGWVVSLVVDGIIAGVGGIMTFLPNIIVLFFALAILEDSGYMSRVAFLMDGIMRKAGLSGKSFLPMIIGFGCSVPAIMATRALENERDRKKTILLTPFMSCSAKLPIYILFSQLFFQKYAMIASFSMYVVGIVLAVILAVVIGKLDPKKTENTLLIELPEYKQPNTRTIMIYVWEKVKDYITKAGTTIFIASIIVWGILNLNFSGLTADITTSFGASLGHWIEPLLAPAGLGMWQIAVALISGLSAKEVVVSSFWVLFGVSANTDLLHANLVTMGFGPANAIALMVFSLLYTPCVAAIGTIKKESDSYIFTLGMVVFQLVFAWCITVLVYQIFNMIL